MEPGLQISQYRRLKGLSQADLASRAGIAQANLSNIEKGKRDLTVSMLLRIAEALEVKPSVLIEKEPSAKPFKLTRTQIEKVAEAVVNPDLKVSGEVRAMVEDFRQIISGTAARASEKKARLAWMNLRRQLTSHEIKGVCQRVEDARQRAHA